MSILRLFDVSQFIASGAYHDSYLSRGCIKVANNYIPQEIPIGGISYLLREIKRFKDKETDLVFCIDNLPTIKYEYFEKELSSYGRYKGNRPRKKTTHLIQRQMATDILEAIGFNVIGCVGYEADDCIASIVNYYAESYDKVYIHTRDSDLYYLVSDKVECVPVGMTGKHVTRENWEDTVLSGWKVPWNTITLHKMFYGESGDNIPAANREVMKHLYSVATEEDIKHFGNNEYLRNFVEQHTDNQQVLAVMYMIMPLILQEYEVQLHDEDIDRELFEYFLQEFRVVKSGAYSPEAAAYGDVLIRRYIEIYSEEKRGEHGDYK